MSDYIEEYKIDDRTYGIEDLKSPGPHSSAERNKRFKCWVDGGGFGGGGYGIYSDCKGHDKLEDARFHIKKDALEELAASMYKAQDVMYMAHKFKVLLEYGGLKTFLVPKPPQKAKKRSTPCRNP